jgi:site-specific recombinase XerC
MTTNLLTAFRLHLADNPLPSRRSAGASEKTIQGYVQDASIFLRWWEQSFGEPLTIKLLKQDPYQINRKTLQDFLSWLQTTQKYQAATVIRYAASLRAFCMFLQQTDVIDHDPTIGLRLPVRKAQEPKGLDDAQRARFEAVFASPWVDKVTKRKRTYETLAGVRLVRDKAIAYLMLFAGPRVEEVEHLHLDDIEIGKNKGMMHIRAGKGNKERDVNLPGSLCKILKEWLKEREKLGIPHDALFVELRGGHRPLSKRSMQSMIAEAGYRAGLEKKDPPVHVTAHVLRHYVECWIMVSV